MRSDRYSILAVDDQMASRELYQLYLNNQFDVTCCSSGQEALMRIRLRPYDLYLVDLIMPGMSGIDLIRRIRDQQPEADIIVISQTEEIDLAIQVFNEDVVDFLRKPVSKPTLLNRIHRFFEWKTDRKTLRGLSRETSRDACCPLPVQGCSKRMQELWKRLRSLAESDFVASILITGESGTGKEVAARLFHQWSSRKDSPFLALNCGLLTRELAASELFGIEKGTATGVDARSGKFSLAHRGTLFLDEIAEMPMELQPMLLRAIQEKKIVRVGGAKEENTDVRLICATNKNLIELMRQGKFREDLYYRISVAVIEMPPLREHPEDIPELLEHLYRRHGGSGPFPLKDDEMTVWKSCLWPGNIRQLENALINWLVDGNQPKQNDPAGMIRQTACCDDIDWNALIARHSFDQIKDRLFRTALSVCQNNVRKASAMLKIPSSTLWDYLQKNRNS